MSDLYAGRGAWKYRSRAIRRARAIRTGTRQARICEGTTQAPTHVCRADNTEKLSYPELPKRARAIDSIVHSFLA